MKKWIIYDARAILGDPDDAQVMVCCDSLKEVKSYAGDYGTHAAVYEYDIGTTNELINQQFVGVLTESGLNKDVEI